MKEKESCVNNCVLFWQKRLIGDRVYANLKSNDFIHIFYGLIQTMYFSRLVPLNAVNLPEFFPI